VSEDRPDREQPPSDSEVRSQFPPHIQSARQFAPTLTAAAIALAVLAAINASLVPLTFSTSLCAIIAIQLLGAVLIGGAAIVMLLRGWIVDEALDVAARARESADRRASGKSMFTGSDGPEETHAAGDVLLAYDRTYQAIGLAVFSLGIVTIAILAIVKTGAAGSSPVFYGLGALNLLVAFACMVGSRWLQTQPSESLPEGRAAGSILRAIVWFATLGAISLLLHGLGLLVIDLWVGRVLLGLVIALSSEQVARAVLSFVGRSRSVEEVRAPIGLVVAESLFAGANPVTSSLEVLEQRFGLSVRSSYVLGYMRRTIPLVFIGMLAAFWATTAFVCVKPEEVGVLTRFGALPTQGWFGPGLHMKFPWPVDRVERIPAERIQTITLGHESTEDPPYLLWSRTHAVDEYKLVLGEGRELVSLDAQVFFRIKNPVQYVVNFQNPRDALEAFAYRVVMREIVYSDLDYVLSEGRAQFSGRLQRALQRDLDAQNMGVDIIKVALRGIHPPVEVANAYQAVVSAQVERVCLETVAEARRAKEVPAAEAAKDTAIKKAEANAATRLADARGEAMKFTSVEEAYSVAPSLYRQRQWLETVERTLAGKRLFLVEGRTAGDREYWVDLRDGASLP